LDTAVSAFAQRDASCASELERDDDRLDRLNRDVFAAAHQLEVSPDGRELALRHVLIARSLERIGDNSVKIAELSAVVADADPRHAGSIEHS
jgi:phosphate uptake regulator